MNRVSGYHRRRFATPAGHWMSVLEGGDPQGAVVMLIHGVAGSTTNWSFQLEPLAQHYRVVVPEMRGHGLTPWPGPSGLEDFYRDMESLLLSFGRPVVVVGHSFGGAIATMLAARLPHRVAGLGLINTGGNIPRRLFYRLLWLFCGRADWFAGHYPWMISTTNHVSRYLLSRTLHEWDSWPLFPRLKMPVLALLGALDVLIPASFGKRLARLMPHARVRVIPWAGHVLMAERPALVNAELETFLRYSFAAFERPRAERPVLLHKKHQQPEDAAELEHPDHAREVGDPREA